MIEKMIQFFKTSTGKAVFLAFLLGVLIGWFAIGWWLWPVSYIDKGYVDVEGTYRNLTLENSINAYAQTGDTANALQGYMSLGKDAGEYYSSLKESQVIPPDVIEKYDFLLQNVGYQSLEEASTSESEETTELAEPVEGEQEPVVSETEEGAVPENKALSRIGAFLGVLFVLFIIVGLVLIYMFIIPQATKDTIKGLFSRSEDQRGGAASGEVDDTPAYLATLGTTDDYNFSVDVEPASYQDQPPAPVSTSSSEPRRSPIERTVNYVHNDAGRSHLDQNFSLKDNDDSGRTVLEYGMAMSDYVEIGGITYALAFDVYLASHPERRTITRVLVNKDLLNHPEVLQRYEGKGEPIKIDEFHTFQLETAKYRLNGTVVAANYVYDEKYGGNYLREMEVDMLIHYL